MKSVAEKLGAKEGKCSLVLNAPSQYKAFTGSAAIDEADIIQFFTTNKDELQTFIEENRSKIQPTCSLWITYPKASPHLGINRDIIADFLKGYQLKPVAICSVDETWSALRFKIL